MCVHVCAELLTHVGLFVTLWTVACQASLSMEVSRQEYWSRLPFPPPEVLLTLGSKPWLFCLLHWQADSLPLCHLGSPVEVDMHILTYWSIFNVFYISVFFFKLFIYFRLCWVFISVRRLSLVAVSGGFSLLGCPGFSLWCLLLWRHGLWVLGLQ